MNNFDWDQYILNYDDLKHFKISKQAITHYNRFGIHEKRTDLIYYYSIFYKNGVVYVIQPIYKDVIMSFKLFNSIGIEYPLTDQVIKYKWEPVIISMFAIPTEQNTLELYLKFKNTQIKETVTHIKTIPSGKFLCLTTMFKNDYAVIPLFYDYYKKQGVDHFYLYYNGRLTDDDNPDAPKIKEICKKLPNVTLIEWKFIYSSKRTDISAHLSQTGELHDAIYRYGKDCYEYIVCCDLDEYLFVSEKEPLLVSEKEPLFVSENNLTLREYIKANPSIDTFAFKQILAKSYERPEKMDTLPKTFQISPTKFEYLTYEESKIKQPCAKCIHKLKTVQTVSQHYADLETAVVDTKNSFYHFFNWTQPNRIKNEPFIEHTI